MVLSIGCYTSAGAVGYRLNSFFAGQDFFKIRYCAMPLSLPSYRDGHYVVRKPSRVRSVQLRRARGDLSVVETDERHGNHRSACARGPTRRFSVQPGVELVDCGAALSTDRLEQCCAMGERN